jgi:UDPglucose--hexose-1-phosphate uridylyltransferase
MPELRQNFFTKEWAIIATERAKRPEELATHRLAQTVPSFVESCLFCPGNESKTPPEIIRQDERALGDASHPQQVRCTLPRRAPTRSLQAVWRRIEGFGFHEVIIDGPDQLRLHGDAAG